MMMRNIDMIRQVSEAARGRWPDVLSLMGIEVPTSVSYTHLTLPTI